MANFTNAALRDTDFHTTFRFGIRVGVDSSTSALGLTSAIEGRCVSTELPCAPGEVIKVYTAGGVLTHTAGKRTVKEIKLEFIVEDGTQASVFKTMEKWSHATFNLNDGSNRGKSVYATDAISIVAMTHGQTPSYTWELYAAQITACDYGTFNAEGNEAYKVSMTLIYDDYDLKDRNGNSLKR